MSLPTYQAIVCSSHFYNPIANSTTAQNFYNNILTSDSVRIAMAEAIEADKPAISAVASQLEHYCDNNIQVDIDLTDDQVRQCFGRIVAEMVKPFGYLPKRTCSKGALSNTLKYFKTGKKYESTGIATETIIKTIVQIP